MLGTNGGGFFNANAAHPFENPTALSNFVQMISIFALGARSPMCSAVWSATRGRLGHPRRDGHAVHRRRRRHLLGGSGGTTALHALGLTAQHGSKEVRFGIVASSLFAVVTTAASCGAVNAMHDSFTALGGHDPADQHAAREIIVGGVGAASTAC